MDRKTGTKRRAIDGRRGGRDHAAESRAEAHWYIHQGKNGSLDVQRSDGSAPSGLDAGSESLTILDSPGVATAEHKRRPAVGRVLEEDWVLVTRMITILNNLRRPKCIVNF